MCHSIGWHRGCCTWSWVAKILLIVGGLNWGLVGLGMLAQAETSWNVVEMVLGSWPPVEAIVYVLVGIAAVMGIFGCRCRKCRSACCCGECAEVTDAGVGMGDMEKKM